MDLSGDYWNPVSADTNQSQLIGQSHLAMTSPPSLPLAVSYVCLVRRHDSGGAACTNRWRGLVHQHELDDSQTVSHTERERQVGAHAPTERRSRRPSLSLSLSDM